MTWVMWLTRTLTAIAVLSICVGFAAWLNATAPEAGQVQVVAGLQQVKVFEARAVPVRRQWRGYGAVASLNRADVPARVTATVMEIPETIQAGRFVTTSDVIARLDSSDFKRQEEVAAQRKKELDALVLQLNVEKTRLHEQLEIEEQDLQLATNEVNRIAGLLKASAAKQQELEAVQRVQNAAQRARLLTQESLDKIEPRRTAMIAMSEGQEAARLLAQQNVERCEIKSPIDGVLQSVDVKPGESLQAGQRVARVVSLSRVEVPVQLPAAARQDIIIGGRVELRASNNTDHCWDATVARLSPEDDPTSRTMTIFVEFDQIEGAKQFGTAAGERLLMPGQFVSATAWSDVFEPRWVVPRRSIRAGRLLVVADGVISNRPVTIDYLNEGLVPEIGVPDNQWAVLVNNPIPLKAGELVVLNASIAVRDGDRIDPIVASGATSEVTTPRSDQSVGMGK